MAAAYTSRFPDGAPFTLLRRMHNLSSLVAVQKQHPAAYVLILWHEIRHLIPDDAWLAWGDLQETARQIGRNPSRETVITGLDQLVGLLGVHCLEVKKIIPVKAGEGSVHFCDLVVQDGETLQVAKVATWRRKTSNVKLYRFVPTVEALDCFARRYYTALREQAFAQAPDQTQPEWGDLIPDDVAEWEAHRSPVYAQYAAQRERAIEQLERRLGYLEQDLERIESGRNQVVTLPPGEIRNAADYRAAFHLARVIDLGGERENAYKARFELGISRSALARVRDRAGLITVERTKVVAAAELTQYQRDYLVKEWHSDGTVTVKLPCAEKLREKASPEEVAAYEQHRADQRERAARRGQPWPVVALETPAPRPLSNPRPKSRVLPLVMWQGYSEAYKRRQYDYCPLPPDFLEYDPVTGEVSTADHLWQRGAAYLRSRKNVEKEAQIAAAETENRVVLPADPVGEANHNTGARIGRGGDGGAPGDDPGASGRLA